MRKTVAEEGAYLGRQDEVRPTLALRFHKQSEECNGLNCLAKAHFVSQDAIDAVVVQRQQEAHAAQLVRAQRPILQRTWLLHLRRMQESLARRERQLYFLGTYVASCEYHCERARMWHYLNVAVRGHACGIM